MSDKRIYPNTVVFKGTDDNEVTYINERVIKQIRAEIGRLTDDNWHIDEFEDGYNTAMKQVLDIIDKHTKGDAE